jgi:hypothetical protein
VSRFFASRIADGRKADDNAVFTELTNQCCEIDIEARGPWRAPRFHILPVPRGRAAVGAPSEHAVAVPAERAEGIEDDCVHEPETAGARSGSQRCRARYADGTGAPASADWPTVIIDRTERGPF